MKLYSLLIGAAASVTMFSSVYAELDNPPAAELPPADPFHKTFHTRFWSTYTPENSPHIGTKDWWKDSYAFGRWWGARSALYDSGVDVSATYTNNLAGNPVGGLSQGFTYTDNIYAGLDFDMNKLVGWQGAHFYVSFLDRNGNNLSQQYIGNQFTVQQIYGNQSFVFYGLLIEQKLLEDRLSIKVGRLGTGDDFASSPIYWLYMNNGIDGNPQALPVNTGFSSYPNAVWGSRVAYKVTDEVNSMFGVYQVNPRNGNMAYHGLDFSIRPDNGVLLITQWGWTPEFFKKPVEAAPTVSTSKDGKAVVGKSLTAPTEMRGLPGNYWMGAYYSAANYAQFGTTSTAGNSYGFYWHADQTVFQETPGSDQGLTLWSSIVLSPQQNIAKVPFQVNGGIVYRGLIPQRDKDVAMVGIVYGEFSDDYASSIASPTVSYPSYELVFEYGYRAQITQFLFIQPNIQYIIQPGGRTDIPNALVLGAQIGVTF